jgi:probable rRNA maturation factor
MISVQVTKNYQGIEVPVHRLRKLITALCNRFALHEATISIAIVDDIQIRRLNKRFLNRSVSTDCLSFDLSEYQDTESDRTFEVVVNGELAQKEARSRGHPSEAELALYVTHGMLHNLGFDDATEAEAKKMHETENEILQQFGYGPVYDRQTKTQRQNGTQI